MKITFIGGSGFVGTRLIEILKEDKAVSYTHLTLPTT